MKTPASCYLLLLLLGTACKEKKEDELIYGVSTETHVRNSLTTAVDLTVYRQAGRETHTHHLEPGAEYVGTTAQPYYTMRPFVTDDSCRITFADGRTKTDRTCEAYRQQGAPCAPDTISLFSLRRYSGQSLAKTLYRWDYTIDSTDLAEARP